MEIRIAELAFISIDIPALIPRNPTLERSRRETVRLADARERKRPSAGTEDASALSLDQDFDFGQLYRWPQHGTVSGLKQGLLLVAQELAFLG